MGNREDLLAGARKAIMERGVAKTTARDIANAAGVSLAAIGYHFGSKDRLITEALAEALGTGIGDSMGELIEATEGRPMSEAFASMVDGLPAVFAANREGMLASLENLLRMARSPESQRFMAESVVEATVDIAATLRETHPHLTQPQAEAIGELYFALTQGLSMLWLINDGALPSGATLSTAFAALADGPETAAR
ncbi:TetR/AcrR family transcriptional regulator [Nocardia amikacinitolerans]|uniref:TetR/AcrR family transcriptional regulator n=1 Tax=Nocardia amikacinitolerans TaxID=756689 RepID=UPI0020A45CA4|nr:TetR/AcrR family transcriptional regulator [Nocardia amikacinitolerans]MCP2275793.1 transcriptional regulator, TetR family [Nocardia amikacinitolerans]